MSLHSQIENAHQRIAERAPNATATWATVYDCIVAVSKAIAQDGIAKTRNNQQQGYKFRGIDEVMNVLSPLLAKHRLVILPRVLSRDVTERVTKTGGALFYVVVEVEFDFVSAADGSKHTVKTYGEAMDSADKATNKAMSAAYKYAAFQTFCIPTEGDNDADAHSHEVVSRTPAAPSGDVARTVVGRGGEGNGQSSHGQAHAPASGVGNPSGPNGEGSAINTATGEEIPDGYHLIDSYTFDRGWHEIVVLGLDAKGGAMKLSTKTPAGDTARQAYYDQKPVRLDWKPKGPRNPGEGYLNKAYPLPDPLPELRGNLETAEHAEPLEDEFIPF